MSQYDMNQMPGEQVPMFQQGLRVSAPVQQVEQAQVQYVPKKLLTTAHNINNIILDQLKGATALLVCTIILVICALGITVAFLATVETGSQYQTAFLAICLFISPFMTYVLAGLVRDLGRSNIINKHNANKDEEISKLLGKWNTNLVIRTIVNAIFLGIIIAAFIAAVATIDFKNPTSDIISAVVLEVLLIGFTFILTYIVQNRLDANQWTKHIEQMNKSIV